MSGESSRLSPAHLVLVFTVVAIWGINFTVAKQVLQHFGTFQTLWLRVVMVSLLLPFFPKPPLKLKTLALLALTFSVGHLGAMFGSMRVGLDASLAAILQQLCIPIVLLLSVIFLNEKVGWRSITGIIVAILGTVVLAGSPNGAANPLGLLLILLSALFWAIYSLQLKQLKQQVNPVAMVTWISIFSIPMMTPFLLLEQDFAARVQSAGLREWLLVGYTAALASVCAHGLWYYLVQRNPMNKVAPFALLTPVLGAVSSVLFLGEPVTFQLLIGGAMMVAGVGIVTVRRARTVLVGEE